MPTFQAFASSRYPHFYPITAISEYFYAVRCLVAPCNSMDYTARQAPLSIGILQARILEWVAVSSSRGSSQPRDRTLPGASTGDPTHDKVMQRGLMGKVSQASGVPPGFS